MINRPNFHFAMLALVLPDPVVASKDKPLDNNNNAAPRFNAVVVQDEHDARFVATIQPSKPIA